LLCEYRRAHPFDAQLCKREANRPGRERDKRDRYAHAPEQSGKKRERDDERRHRRQHVRLGRKGKIEPDAETQ
jgi:hypothetical protein